MSFPIQRWPKDQRAAVVQRRLKEQHGGLGYWAAVDAQRRLAEAAALRAKRTAA